MILSALLTAPALQSALILFCGCSEPECVGCAQGRFDDCSVELAQQLLWHTILPLIVFFSRMDLMLVSHFRS